MRAAKRPLERLLLFAPGEDMQEMQRPGIRARLAGAGGALLLRLLSASWRTRIEGIENVDALLSRGEGLIAIFWHEKYLPLFPLMQNRNVCAFTTPSFRGDVISELCRRFGYACEQLPRESGKHALDHMRKTLVTHRAGALAVDGPSGPFHQVKPGAVLLASELGFRIVPVSCASRRRSVKERWDRQEIPLPFTRVSVVFGDPISIPSGLDEGDVRDWSRRLGYVLEGLDAAASTAL